MHIGGSTCVCVCMCVGGKQHYTCGASSVLLIVGKSDHFASYHIDDDDVQRSWFYLNPGLKFNTMARQSQNCTCSHA